MIYKLLVLMLIAHILGDFYFQTDKMASEKDNSLKGVIIHAIEYTFSVFLVMIPVINSNILILILYMSLLHFIIDILKFFLLKRKIIKKTGMLFVCDQLLHITSIFILAYIMACNNIKFSHFQIIRNICDVFEINSFYIAKWGLAILILHIPSNILIQNLLSGYRPKKENSNFIEFDNKAGRKI